MKVPTRACRIASPMNRRVFKWSARCIAGLLSFAGGVYALQPPSAAAVSSRGFYETPFERKPDAKSLVSLGRTLFFDRALSASGQLACASCHQPSHAFGPADARGPTRALPLRAVPSLSYRSFTPAFDAHHRESDGNDAEDQGPVGGWDWDGRAASAHEQAEGPLLSPLEMNNRDAGAVVARLRSSASAVEFRRTFGPRSLDDERVAWNGLLWALEVFQQDPATFAPFTSKYDAALRGQVVLSPAERRGLEAFNDPARGNCAACHPSGRVHGGMPLFTDFGHVALGVPRNRTLPPNAQPAFHDLGLGGPLRLDMASTPEACGRFKTPSLRNVALRPAFFHNGAFTHLDDAVRFYALRDHEPARYYGRDAQGRPRQPDDLPDRCLGNLERGPPFGRHARPSLTENEVQDIVRFLETLTDGHVPPAR